MCPEASLISSEPHTFSPLEVNTEQPSVSTALSNKTAYAGDRQPTVGFDLFDHRTKRVDVRGQGARSVGCLSGSRSARPFCNECAFAGAHQFELFERKIIHFQPGQSPAPQKPVGEGVFRSLTKTLMR